LPKLSSELDSSSLGLSPTLPGFKQGLVYTNAPPIPQGPYDFPLDHQFPEALSQVLILAIVFLNTGSLGYFLM
jgi:hypothetical protein